MRKKLNQRKSEVEADKLLKSDLLCRSFMTEDVFESEVEEIDRQMKRRECNIK